MNTVAVIDYGMGNLRSVAKALEHVSPNAVVQVTNDAAVIAAADRIVLPGVGALRDAMSELKRLSLDVLIKQWVSEKPFLGICLGMQALFDHSEENQGCDGLGIIAGEVRYFGPRCVQGDAARRLKVPHMGWSSVNATQDHPLWHGIVGASRFYFVHSYYVDPADPTACAGRCDYGGEFCAAVSHGKIFAVQFHPEKSQLLGLRLLSNFMQWDGC